MNHNELAPRDEWHALRAVTSARIALGRAGGSIPTREWLEFKSAHALARDAVHNDFDAQGLASEIFKLSCESIVVDSSAEDRSQYLQRPDWGRRLTADSRNQLQNLIKPSRPYELAVVVSDGLSALAVESHAIALLSELLPKLRADSWSLSPIVIARFGRVALEDEVGSLLAAEIALMLIGERPGLGAPDSLGAYLVHSPRIGNSDANRNCVSNIRTDGLTPKSGAETLYYLLTESKRRGLSGVSLKDERCLPSKLLGTANTNYLEKD